MDFQQSKTYANLQTAFNSELMTSTRYEIYSDQARRDGYIEISQIYNTVADEEKSHAVIWLRKLNDGNIPSTEINLSNTVEKQEKEEYNMYTEFSRIAREEGYDDIASLFNGVANIELNHEVEFQRLYENVVNDQVFCKENEVLWICINCGNIMNGKCAPKICPVCDFPQGYYKVFVASNL